jgi:hypothetical protein
MMDIALERKEFFDDRTIGAVYDETGKFRWFSLEDKDRKLEEGGIKIPKETAIPRGRYRVTLVWSPKRNALVPLLLGVPQFTGIEIHIGNKPEDTEGCILLGLKYNAPDHQIYESTLACSEFYPWLFKKLVESGDDLWITVR